MSAVVSDTGAAIHSAVGSESAPALLQHFELLATAPGGVAKLRELILTLAVQGKLVAQDPVDEPASELLKKIRAEKDRLIAEGKIKRDKPLAAITEEEKPFALPQGWEWVRIPVVSYNLGQCDPIKSFSYIDVSAINNTIGIINKDIQAIDPSDAPSRARKIVAVGTVLYSTIRPYLKNIAVVEFEYDPEPIASTAFAVMHPHNGVASKYLLHYLRSQPFTEFVNSKAVGVAYPAINDANFFQGVIPLPPTAEQSRIVTRVEELMRLCDALEAKGKLDATQHAQLLNTLLGQLHTSATPEELATDWQRVAQHFDLLLDRPEAVDALEQTLLQLAVRGLLVPQDPSDEPARALLQRIRTEKDRLISEGKIKRDKPLPPITEEEKPFGLPVGWEWVRLDAVFRVITDGDHLPPPVAAEGIAFLTIGNISAGRLNFNGCRLVPKDYFDALADYRRPKDGDILYTVVGASYGRAVVVDSDRAFCVQRHIGILKPSIHMSLQYLSYLLSSQLIYAQATGSLTGTAQPTVGIRLLRNFLAPLPPLPEQSRIVTRVAELRRLCANLRQRLAERQSVQAHLAEALAASVA